MRTKTSQMKNIKTVFLVAVMSIISWNAVAQNVGIGTATPLHRLDIAGDLAFRGPLVINDSAGAPGAVLTSMGPTSSPQWISPNKFTLYGTSSILIRDTNHATLIPGLMASIVLINPAVVEISTDGGIQTSSNLSSGYSCVTVSILVDGALVRAGNQRVQAVNNSAITGCYGPRWSRKQYVPLTPGTHTIGIYAAGCNSLGDPAYVSDPTASYPVYRQGVLSISW